MPITFIPSRVFVVIGPNLGLIDLLEREQERARERGKGGNGQEEALLLQKAELVVCMRYWMANPSGQHERNKIRPCPIHVFVSRVAGHY